MPVALNGLMLAIQWARYCFQLTRLLKNLSMLMTIGRTLADPEREERLVGGISLGALEDGAEPGRLG